MSNQQPNSAAAALDDESRFMALMDRSAMFEKLSGQLMRHYVSQHEPKPSDVELDALADGEHRGAQDCAKCAQLVEWMDAGALNEADAKWLSEALS